MSLFSMSKIVLKNLFSRPATRMYPFAERKLIKNSRGKIMIKIEDCVYCGLCRNKCPTAAISVEREAKKWGIDRLRCITCNYCVDVCPKKCLRMESEHSKPTVTKDKEYA